MRSCVLDLNRWRRQRGDRPVVSYQELCRELSTAGPGTFGELDTEGARSVLRRYSDDWFSAAKRRSEGNLTAPVPATEEGPGLGSLVLRYIHAELPDAPDPHGTALPAACGAAGQGCALPGRADPVGHPRLG